MGNSVLWPLSMTQINDVNGKPYIGAKAHFYEGDTNDDLLSGPWTDKEMTVAHPNPVLTNGFGMWPVVFLDGTPNSVPAKDFYGLKITDGIGAGDGSMLMAKTVLPIGGPPSTGDAPIPAGDLLPGDLQPSYLTGERAGYVRANGDTIGDAASTATEKKDAACEALFELLWNANKAHFKVEGGRGASAAGDWALHKAITLPDLRGRTIVGRNTMGASAVSGALQDDAIDIGGDDFNGTSNADGGKDVVGSHGGNDLLTLDLDNIPAHRHTWGDVNDATVKAEAVTTLTGDTDNAGVHFHDYKQPEGESGVGGPNAGQASVIGNAQTEAAIPTESAGNHRHGLNNVTVETVLDLKMSLAGGDQTGGLPYNTVPHKNMGPFGIVTYYIKL